MITPDDPRPDVEGACTQVRALIERRRHALARRLLAEALRAHPDEVELLYLQAFIDHREGRLADAEHGVATVLARSPCHPGTRALQAQLYADQARGAPAEAIWMGLLRDDPGNPSHLVQYGRLMLETGRVERARQLMQQALSLAPQDRGALYLACLLRRVDGPLKLDDGHVQRLMHAHPDAWETLLILCQALRDGDRVRDALDVARQLVAMDPDSRAGTDQVRDLTWQLRWRTLPVRHWHALYYPVTLGAAAAAFVAELNLPAIPAHLITLGLLTLWVVFMIVCPIIWRVFLPERP